MGYFPVRWVDKEKMRFITESVGSFQKIDSVKELIKGRPLYFLVVGDVDQPVKEIAQLKINLQKNTILLNSDNFVSLYKLR